jgi:hypothetical protein
VCPFPGLASSHVSGFQNSQQNASFVAVIPKYEKFITLWGGEINSVKKTVAKFVLLTSMVLSAYSIVGAVATKGHDGPMPDCPWTSCPVR